MKASWARHGKASICPHCGDGAQFHLLQVAQIGGVQGFFSRSEKTEGPQETAILEGLGCTLCGGIVAQMYRQVGGEIAGERRVYPSLDAPPSLPPEVPDDLGQAYAEAWQLRGLSERAAAVLARRCLQLSLRKEGFRAKSRNLADEIRLAEESVSPGLATQLHVVRHIGNFGAHPVDANGGQDYVELVDVTPGEVEALFSAIDDYFDERFVRPAKRKAALELVNEKLQKAGMKPLIPADSEKTDSTP